MSPCTGCHAGCCRSFAVPISGADILRIERDRGMSFWDFACRWEDRDNLIARSSVPHFHFDDEPATPFAICLQHDTSAVFPTTTKCRFLSETPPDAEHALGQAACSLYESRPGACRVFPTRLNAESLLAIIYDVPERGRDADEGDAYRLCSRPWQPADLDPVQTWQDLVVTQAEMTFFREVAQLWNRQPGPWSIFPEFLRVVYDGRIVAEQERPATLPMTRPEPSVNQRRAA